MLDATSPDPGVLELRQDLFVDSVAEVFDGGRGGVQHHRGAVVRDLSLGLGVDSNHVCGLPDPLHQLLQVPLVAEVCEERDGSEGGREGSSLSGYGDVVRHLVDDVELLDGQLVDLVQHIDGGEVATVSL
jgi:hypothetical protein